MLILYDINHNKIAPLIKHRDLRIERDLSGQQVLFFSYPHKNADDIKEECYVRTKAQEFVVKEISDRGDWSQVVGKVNLEDIKGKSVENFETINATITNAINLALVGTGWTLAYTDITKLRTVRKANCGAFDVLEEIRKIYRAEFKFDAISKTISAYASMGKDKGAYFTDELNLRNLAVQSNSYDFCTRLIPIGKDGLKITDVNGGIEYVENHQYSNKVITRIWEDNRYTDAQSLREDAIAKLDELSKPVKAYSAGIIDLARANDKYADILDYGLGDTITLVSREKRIKEKQRIVKIAEYPDEPERNTCEIANRTLRLEDMQSDALDAADTVDSITTSDGMVDDSKVNLDPIRQEFGSIVAEKADITDLQAAEGRIGTLEATSATITQLEAVEADIDHLTTNKADIGELTAATGRISVLEGDVADIDTILSKQVFVELATAGQILAGSGIIADGAIGNAHISNLDVDKLNSGILSTAKFTVQGSGGRLKIADNLLQVFDGTSQLFERVALGDLEGDSSVYGLRIRGADGQTTLLDHDGLTDAGFTDGYSKLADDSLDPAKLDIAQVVTRINDGTETIQSSKIYMDNQNLEAAFSTLETTVSDQGETISSHGSSISAMSDEIEIKVDSQEFNTYKTTNDQNITTINTTLFTQGSSITALQDEIQLKVTQAEIDTSIDAVQEQIDTHETRISTAESEISQNATDITARVTTSTFNTTVNNITGEVDALEGRVGTAELVMDGLNSQIALKADATVVDGLGTRVSSAELVIDGLEGEIELKVDKDGVISSINQTAEAIRISANRIEISGQTTFASGYDPSTKETPAGAQSKVDAFATSLATTLGELAYEDVVEQAMLGSTIISGGYIRTNLLDVDNIIATGSIIVTGSDISELTNNVDYRTGTQVQNTANAALNAARNDVALRLGYANYADMVAAATAGNTIIDGGYIRTELIDTTDIVFSGTLSGATGTFSGKVHVDGLSGANNDIPTEVIVEAGKLIINRTDTEGSEVDFSPESIRIRAAHQGVHNLWAGSVMGRQSFAVQQIATSEPDYEHSSSAYAAHALAFHKVGGTWQGHGGLPVWNPSSFLTTIYNGHGFSMDFATDSDQATPKFLFYATGEMAVDKLVGLTSPNLIELGNAGCSIDMAGGDARWKRDSGNYILHQVDSLFLYMSGNLSFKFDLEDKTSYHCRIRFGQATVKSLGTTGAIQMRNYSDSGYVSVRASEYFTSSSIEFKKDVQRTVVKGLDAVRGSAIYDYHFMDDSDGKDKIGLIAEEAPEVIRGGDNGEMLSMNSMIAVLWKAVQELSDELEVVKLAKNEVIQ